MNTDVYFKDQDWHICIKKVNTRNFTITYEEKGGYKSKEAAWKAKEQYDQTYAEKHQKDQRNDKHPLYVYGILEILAGRVFL